MRRTRRSTDRRGRPRHRCGHARRADWRRRDAALFQPAGTARRPPHRAPGRLCCRRRVKDGTPLFRRRAERRAAARSRRRRARRTRNVDVRTTAPAAASGTTAQPRGPARRGNGRWRGWPPTMPWSQSCRHGTVVIDPSGKHARRACMRRHLCRAGAANRRTSAPAPGGARSSGCRRTAGQQPMPPCSRDALLADGAHRLAELVFRLVMARRCTLAAPLSLWLAVIIEPVGMHSSRSVDAVAQRPEARRRTPNCLRGHVPAVIPPKPSTPIRRLA